MMRLLPIALILVAIGLFFLYTNPTYTTTVVQEQQQIASYDRALAASKTFVQKENTLMTERSSISDADITRLESFLPDSVDNIQLILDLSGLGARSGVTLSNFAISSTGSPSSSASPSGSIPTTSLTNSLQLSVSVTGSYQAFRTFLANAEQSLRLLDVTSLTVNSSDTGLYTYTVNFNLYWLI